VGVSGIPGEQPGSKPAIFRSTYPNMVTVTMLKRQILSTDVGLTKEAYDRTATSECWWFTPYDKDDPSIVGQSPCFQ